MSLVFTPEGTPASPVEGEVYYDSTADKLKVRDSSAFREVVTQDATFNGTIGSSATFPNEKLVAHHDFSTPLSETVTVDGDKYTSTIKIDLTGVTSGNSLLVCANGQVAHNTSTTTSDYATLYLSSDEADSGIGATTSGKTIINEFGRYSNDWFNLPVSRSVLVQNVTNTAPTYKIYIDKTGSTSWTLYLTNWLFYVLEFKG